MRNGSAGSWPPRFVASRHLLKSTTETIATNPGATRTQRRRGRGSFMFDRQGRGTRAPAPGGAQEKVLCTIKPRFVERKTTAPAQHASALVVQLPRHLDHRPPEPR